MDDYKISSGEEITLEEKYELIKNYMENLSYNDIIYFTDVFIIDKFTFYNLKWSDVKWYIKEDSGNYTLILNYTIDLVDV